MDLVFLIPVVAVPSIAAVVIAFSPAAKAFAAARGKGAVSGEPDPALVQKLAEQEGRLLMAEDEIEKLRDRLEFTERLISAPAGPESPPGS